MRNIWHYYKGERGNKPFDLELMLLIYLLQNLYHCMSPQSRKLFRLMLHRSLHAGLLGRYEAVRARVTVIEDTQIERTVKRTYITHFLEAFVKYGDMVTEFDDEL